ncbi:MAG: GNAT family N-acetyltransferase [Dehalococcoidia bacterium]|nr:GNAT family N-acetyltransferase [Dehalococcoidia bacterium]
MANRTERWPTPPGLRPVSLTGRWVTLTPALPDDLDAMYAWRVAADGLHLWSVNRKLPSFGEARAEIETIVVNSLLFLIARNRRGDPIGFIQFYNASPVDGFCYFMEYIAPPFQATLAAGEMPIIATEYLFDSFPFRKLYAEVYDHNPRSFRQLKRAGFIEQGYTPDHVYYKGVYWGITRLALTREGWDRFRSKFTHLHTTVVKGHQEEQHLDWDLNFTGSGTRLASPSRS